MKTLGVSLGKSVPGAYPWVSVAANIDSRALKTDPWRKVACERQLDMAWSIPKRQ